MISRIILYLNLIILINSNLFASTQFFEQGLKLFNYVESDLFSIQGISMIQLCQFLWDNNLLFESHVI